MSKRSITKKCNTSDVYKSTCKQKLIWKLAHKWRAMCYTALCKHYQPQCSILVLHTLQSSAVKPCALVSKQRAGHIAGTSAGHEGYRCGGRPVGAQPELQWDLHATITERLHFTGCLAAATAGA